VGKAQAADKEFDVTVTSKGQLTLPAAIRRAARISEGSKLRVTLQPDGEVRLRRRLTLDDIAGSLSRKYPGLSFTQEDIDAAITQAVTEKWERAVKRPKRPEAPDE
jgi:antitoxin PrlF